MVGENAGSERVEDTDTKKAAPAAEKSTHEKSTPVRASLAAIQCVTRMSQMHTSRLTGYHTLANSLEGEELIDFLGKDVIKKIRRADLKRLKGTASSDKPTTKAPAKSRQKKGKAVDPYEALRKLEF